MATRREAEKALDQHADELATHGAHALGIGDGEEYGKSGFVVVAYVEQPEAARLPKSLSVSKSGRRVPLVLKQAERFRPQTLG